MKSRVNRTALLLNGAGILIAGATMATIIRSIFVEEHVPRCHERMENSLRISFERNGAPLSPPELQARFGATEWGLLDGGRVVKLKSGPAKIALELDLASAPSVTQRDEAQPDRKPGIGFNWVPQSMKGPRAACLSYSVFVPDDFTFGKGGRLPGLMGTVPQAAVPLPVSEGTPESEPPSDDEAAAGVPSRPGFAVLPVWNGEGAIDIVALPNGARDARPVFNHFATSLPRGKWSEIELEVQMNTPGEGDGIIRMWANGELVYHNNQMSFLSDDGAFMAGVRAEAIAGDVPTTSKRGLQKLWLTPFELHWK